MKAFIVCTMGFALLVWNLVAVGDQEIVLQYEPAIVTITGKIVLENHYGPPGFGESPAKDKVSKTLMLMLEQPISVEARANDDLNMDSYQGVRKIQILSGKNFPIVKKLVGKKVSLKGTLSEKISGEHYTDVLIDVCQIVGY